MSAMLHNQQMISRRLAYIVNHSLPYSNNGYAARTHEVACALGKLGFEVIVFNRPGSPWDRSHAKLPPDVPLDQTIDGVRYVFLPSPAPKKTSRGEKVQVSKDILKKAFITFKPAAILAASNWEVGLPAMTAAHDLDIPFFYEQRGFWEMSVSSDADLDQANELRVCRGAEVVFTLNTAMRQELSRRGVPFQKTKIVANGVSDRGKVSVPLKRTDIGSNATYLVGYIGSLSDYEGLEDLVDAVALMRAKGRDIDLMIVGGNGTASRNQMHDILSDLARSKNVGNYLKLVPEVPLAHVSAYYQLLDAFVLPRRRTRMTELVPPLKPFAAAPFRIRTCMSDLLPLVEIATELDAEIFRESDPLDLSNCLGTLLDSDQRTLKANLEPLNWTNRVAPMAAALNDVEQRQPSIRMLPSMAHLTKTRALARRPENFDIHQLPAVALSRTSVSERTILCVGPGTELAYPTLILCSRANLLELLATKPPGLFIIDWAGLSAGQNEWSGLWTTDQMSMNRQIMDACRISRDRGWEMVVTNRISAAEAPLFQTVSKTFSVLEPKGKTK